MMMRRQRTLHGIRWAAALALALVILGYSGFEAKRVLEGPAIALDAPSDGGTVDTSIVRITGITRNASALTLNGRLIPIDTTGRFDEQLLLSYGYNILELVATDRSGNTLKKPVTIFYQ